MSCQGQLGLVASIHRYPVKSMMGEELNAVHIGSKGLRGDRAFALGDPATGKVASAKNPAKWPTLFQFRANFSEPVRDGNGLPPVRITLPDGDVVSTADRDVDDRISRELGKPVRLLKSAPASATLEEYWPDIDDLAKRDVVTDEPLPPETFFDVGIVHLLTTGTLDGLRAAYPQGRFEPRRFRPNLVIQTEAGAPAYPENEWHEKIVSIGDTVRLKITGPCGRCVMTTLGQGDLPKDTGILKTAAKQNQARVGVYAEVLAPGVIRAGDPVSLQ